MHIAKKFRFKKIKLKINKKKIFLTALLLTFGATGSFSGITPTAQAAPDCPGDVLDLSSWKITLPTGGKKPTEIEQPKLADYSADPYFKLYSKSEGVVFRAPVDGATTSNSGYPRSELREMKNGGKELASWSTTSGRHTMFIDQAITTVPKEKKHVVAGQVHDADDDVIVIRLEYPKLFVDINGKTGPTLDPNYSLGKRFTVKFVAENGQIKIFYNSGTAPAYTLNKKTSGCYFKAGAYTQSNCSKESSCSESNFGEVAIYRLLLNREDLESRPSPAPNQEASSQSNEAVSSEKAPKASSAPAPEPENPKNPSDSPSQNEETSPSSILSIEPFEAEKGLIKGGMRVMEDDPDASGGKYILASSYGSIEYLLNIPEEGKYRIAGLIKAKNSSSDSFKVLVDEKSKSTWTLTRPAEKWRYDLHDGKIFSLKPGEHKMTLQYREEGAKIDKIILVKQ